MTRLLQSRMRCEDWRHRRKAPTHRIACLSAAGQPSTSSREACGALYFFANMAFFFVAAMTSGFAWGGASLSFASSPHAPAPVAPAFARSTLKPPALPEGGVYESLGDDLRLQGLALAAWAFDAPGSVQEMTAWFSARQPALRDMWIMRDSVVLGGIVETVQWVVRMSDAGSKRTSGTVSALPLAAADRPASGAQALAGRIELKGATRVFELQMREKGHTVVQQVWTHPLAPAQACGRARDQLGDAGWRAASTQDAWGRHGCGSWTRASSSLSIIAVAREAGSGIATILRIEDIPEPKE